MSGFSDVGICDAFVFEPKLFGDERGYFFELYREFLSGPCPRTIRSV